MSQRLEKGSEEPTDFEMQVTKVILRSTKAVASFNHYGVVDVDLKDDGYDPKSAKLWIPKLIDVSPEGWNLGLSKQDFFVCIPEGGGFFRRLISSRTINIKDIRPIYGPYGIKKVDEDGYLLQEGSGDHLVMDTVYSNILRHVKVRLDDPCYTGGEVVFIPFVDGRRVVERRRWITTEIGIPYWKPEGPVISDCIILDPLTKRRFGREMELLGADFSFIGRYR